MGSSLSRYISFLEFQSMEYEGELSPADRFVTAALFNGTNTYDVS